MVILLVLRMKYKYFNKDFRYYATGSHMEMVFISSVCLSMYISLCHTWLWRCYSYIVNGIPECCRTSCILWTLHSKPQTKNFQLKMSVMLMLGKVMCYSVPPKSSTLSKAPQRHQFYCQFSHCHFCKIPFSFNGQDFINVFCVWDIPLFSWSSEMYSSSSTN